MSIRCLLGAHRWETYLSGQLGVDFVERQWCPHCRADCIVMGGYRMEVTKHAWDRETPAEFHAEMDRLRADIEATFERGAAR